MSETTPIPETGIDPAATYADAGKRILALRTGKRVIATGELNDNGKPKKKMTAIPAVIAERDFLNALETYLTARGSLFNGNGTPYYFDSRDCRVHRVSPSNAEFAAVMRELSFQAKQPHTDKAYARLIDTANLTEHAIHRLAYFHNNTVYVRITPSLMLKITPDAVAEVPLGTDNVYLIADDLGDWPRLAELQPLIDELRLQVGDTCTRYRLDLPSHVLTTRFADTEYLTAEQQRQFAFGRILFQFVASRYALWPLLLILGLASSGKSSFVEIWNVLLRGGTEQNCIDKSAPHAFPEDSWSFSLLATRNSYITLDNVDGDVLQGREASTYLNKLCQMSTGGLDSRRVLYTDDSIAEHRLRNHIYLTACDRPFDRNDAMRRVIELYTEAPDGKYKDRTDLLCAAVNSRAAIFAEFILRLQNIAKAHAAHDRRFSVNYASKMPEYELYTYICALHEGSIDDNRDLWRGYAQRYSKSISENDPLVYAVRLWLGVRGDDNVPRNDGRKVRSEDLYMELNTLYTTRNLKLPYTSIAQFRRNLKEHMVPLQTLGFNSKRDKDGNLYWFTPDADTLAECVTAYKAYAGKAASKMDFDDYTITAPETIS